MNIANGASVRFDRTATIDGEFNAAGNYQLIVNGDLTLNDNDLNWDGAGTSTTTINSGGRLEINATTIDADDDYDGTINIESGVLDVDVAATSWNLAGTLNLASTDSISVVTGTNLFVTGDIVADAGGSRITTAVQFEPTSSTHVEAGSDLFFTQPVTFKGGSSHTGTLDGELSFGSNITVDAPTTINMPTGRVQIDSNSANQTLAVNNDLTINALSLRSSVGASGAGTYSINIDNTDATLNVNLSPGNEWTLGADGVINIAGVATLQTSLDGSPVNVQGDINVNNSTRFDARIDLQTGGTVDINGGTTVLFLEGGSQADPNRLEGGIYSGNGELHAFSSGVRGYGQINNDIFFNGGSDLIAEGGTLVLNGEVLAVDKIGAATGGTLLLGQALQTANFGTTVEMSGGTIASSSIENFGATTGHGEVATSGFINHNLLQASGGGELVINTVNAPDLDGLSGTPTIQARSADLVVAGTLADAFDAIAPSRQVKPWNSSRVGRWDRAASCSCWVAPPARPFSAAARPR